MKKINIFDLKFNNKEKNTFLNTQKIFDEGFFSDHTYVKKFEQAFKKYNCKYTLATSSGTSALEIILRALEIKNKKVLVNSNTFIATGHAITNAGGEIVPVDLDMKYFLMSPEDLEER